jgi:hypothetical protein
MIPVANAFGHFVIEFTSVHIQRLAAHCALHALLVRKQGTLLSGTHLTRRLAHSLYDSQFDEYGFQNTSAALHVSAISTADAQHHDMFVYHG